LKRSEDGGNGGCQSRDLADGIETFTPD
jgi:hypothetical protein